MKSSGLEELTITFSEGSLLSDISFISLSTDFQRPSTYDIEQLSKQHFFVYSTGFLGIIFDEGAIYYTLVHHVAPYRISSFPEPLRLNSN